MIEKRKRLGLSNAVTVRSEDLVEFGMVGYIRIRLAFERLSLGVGGFVAILAYLVRSGFVSLSPDLMEITTYILIFISVAHLLAEILNITAKS